MPITEKIAETDEGQYDLRGNEAVLRDKVGDPVAWKGQSRNGGIAKWGIDAIDARGNAIEIGYLFGKRDERYPNDFVGEFQFWIKRPGTGSTDDAVSMVCAFRHDGVSTPSVGAGPAMQLWDVTGQYFAQIQNDGNFVAYKASVPFSIANPEAVLFDWFSIQARLAALEARV